MWDLQSLLQHLVSLVVASGIWLPDRGSNLSLGACSLSQWTTREVPLKTVLAGKRLPLGVNLFLEIPKDSAGTTPSYAN